MHCRSATNDRNGTIPGSFDLLRRCAASAILLLGICNITAAGVRLHVHHTTGSDLNDGSAEKPFLTIQAAIHHAPPASVIELHPKGAIYRQMAVFRGRTNVTLEGNGVTLTGADPLDSGGWETLANDLHRRQLPATPLGRHLLIQNGRANRMGRVPSTKEPFPAPDKLQPGEFSWQPIDAKSGWLYVKGSIDKLEWSTRVAGIATSGVNRGIVIRNIHCRHALNDGFNIHGDCRDLYCEDISGLENFDEGFSAHDTCSAVVHRGRFYRNENAVADVNFADTDYHQCEFGESISHEILFSGGRHLLTDCTVAATGRVAVSISTGAHGDVPEIVKTGWWLVRSLCFVVSE